MILKIHRKTILLMIISIIFMANFLIFFDIPIFRQIFGIFFLTVIPGFLLLQLFKLEEVGIVTKIILLVGLSISFLLIYGLFVNQILIYFGFLHPLSTNSLLISFDLAFFLLIIVLYNHFQDIVFDVSSFKLTRHDKAALILPILFPALIIFGIYFMNTKDNNCILLLTLILIPIYVAYISFVKSKLSINLYPFAIYSISISLLLIFMLRFTHISGHDVHLEYYIFQKTLEKLQWSIFLHNTLDSTLSISLLPAIFQAVLNTNSQEFLFKSIYVFSCSFCPLAIYVTANNYIDKFYAFLTSIFFMSQLNFLQTAGSPRTNLAIFFVALLAMILSNDKISLLKKRLMFLIFVMSIILSHYSTTYITFFMFAFSFITLELLFISKKFTFEKIIKFNSIVLFFILIFFWYSQITEVTFTKGVEFIGKTIAQFNNFFVEEARSSKYTQLAGEGLSNPIVSRIHLFVTLSSFFFIATGVLNTIYKYQSMIYFSNIRFPTFSFLKRKFEVQYSAMAVACSGILVITFVLPYISLAYGIERLFFLTTVFLSIYFVMGGIIISKHLHIKPHLLILIILLPYFMFNSGVAHELLLKSGPITLNSNSPSYDRENIYESESISAKWLNNIQKNSLVYTTDYYTSLRLVSQNIFLQQLIRTDCFKFHEKPSKGYIYLGYNNVINEELVIERITYDIKDYIDIFIDVDKIYDNGKSEIHNL